MENFGNRAELVIFHRKEVNYMKQSAIQKHQSLSLVTVRKPEQAAEDFAISSFVVRPAFSGRHSDLVLARRGQYPRPLTTEDFVQVELATLREGRKARLRWPREVLEKFLAADVIKREQ
jgi:hypothetical protein